MHRDGRQRFRILHHFDNSLYYWIVRLCEGCDGRLWFRYNPNMPSPATIYKVLMALPGDVQTERLFHVEVRFVLRQPGFVQLHQLSTDQPVT